MKIEETKQAISAAKAGRFVFVPNLPNSDMICTTDDLKALAADHTRLVEALKFERERREVLEVVAAGLYLGHLDGRSQFDKYKAVYLEGK